MSRKRWLVVYVDPKSGRERVGYGFPDNSTAAYYVSVDNVIKFHLNKPNFPAGQYHIYLWPEGFNNTISDKPTVAYKRA